jgi:predicted amidophosphoribosyltransferase
MLLDSCRLCFKILWKTDVFCGACLSDLAAQPFIYRPLGQLDTLSGLHYHGEARSLVKHTKNGMNPLLSQRMGEILAQKLSLNLVENVAGVIPIPSKIFGEKDHAFLLAQSVAGFFKAPLLPGFLERESLEVAQKQKDIVSRQRVGIRLREALPAQFSAERGVLILVDDVITTGSTLVHAWNSLGKPRAIGLTWASTPRFIENAPKIW